MTEKTCLGCSEPFEIDEDEAWRTLCSFCVDSCCEQCGHELEQCRAEGELLYSVCPVCNPEMFNKAGDYNV